MQFSYLNPDNNFVENMLILWMKYPAVKTFEELDGGSIENKERIKNWFVIC